jgi:hypothetical protein
MVLRGLHRVFSIVRCKLGCYQNLLEGSVVETGEMCEIMHVSNDIGNLHEYHVVGIPPPPRGEKSLQGESFLDLIA